MYIYRFNRNKSPLKIFEKNSHERSQDSGKFAGHPYVWRIARSTLRQLSFFVIIESKVRAEPIQNSVFYARPVLEDVEKNTVINSVDCRLSNAWCGVWTGLYDFYRAMHFSAKRGLAIEIHVVRPSVCL